MQDAASWLELMSFHQQGVSHHRHRRALLLLHQCLMLLQNCIYLGLLLYSAARLARLECFCHFFRCSRHRYIGDTKRLRALMIAFIKAGGDAMAPASPHPFTPRSLWVQAVTVLSTLNDGRSSARGRSNPCGML